MAHDAAKYRKALSRHLPCCRSAKARVLKEFSASMDAYLEEYPHASYAQLCEAFGPPEDMAQTLYAQVTPKEIGTYKTRQNILRVIGAVALAAFLAVTVYIYFYMRKPLEHTDTVTRLPTYQITPTSPSE